MSDARLVLASAFALAAAVAGAAQPYTGYYYPSSMQAGTKVRVITGGQGCKKVTGGYITGEGVRITGVTHVSNFSRAPGKTQRPFVYRWIYDKFNGDLEHRDLPPEAKKPDTDWAVCDWWANVDQHDELEMQIMLRWLYTPENYPQPTPALDNLTILDIEADANAKPGRRDIVIYDNRDVSVPHSFYITADPHLVEPHLVVPPQSKTNAPPTVTLHWPGELQVHDLPVTFDGQCWPGEEDHFGVKLVKGDTVTFELIGRELLPYLGDAVPGWFNPVMRIVDPRGREVAFADDFNYLPDPIISLRVPETGTYTIQVHDNLYRGRSDFVYFVRCYKDKPDGHAFTPQQKAFECFAMPASHEAPNKATAGLDVRTGTIDCPGRVVRNVFTVKEPTTLSFELFARRNGSPLDGVLKLYGPLKPSVPLASTPLLATWNDVDKFLAGSIPQAICDPVGSWAFTESGDYCVTVSDNAGEGGECYSYTLAIGPLEPSFEVYAERSSFRFKPGGSASFKAQLIRKNGFTGDVRFVDGDGLSFSGAFIDGETKTEIGVTAEKDWKGLKVAQFYATGELPDGRVKKVRVTPADPAEQAFAYTHLLSQSAFFLCMPGD